MRRMEKTEMRVGGWRTDERNKGRSFLFSDGRNGRIEIEAVGRQGWLLLLLLLLLFLWLSSRLLKRV